MTTQSSPRPLVAEQELASFPLVSQPDDSMTLGVCFAQYGVVACGRFAWPKSSKAPLRAMSCPVCGNLLSQTTRQARSGFRLLPGDVAQRLAHPRLVARRDAEQARNTAMAEFEAATPEPTKEETVNETYCGQTFTHTRNTPEWYAWAHRRADAGNAAYQTAYNARLSAERAGGGAVMATTMVCCDQCGAIVPEEALPVTGHGTGPCDHYWRPVTPHHAADENGPETLEERAANNGEAAALAARLPDADDPCPRCGGDHDRIDSREPCELDADGDGFDVAAATDRYPDVAFTASDMEDF
jgi:hypothetical protein